MRGDKKIGLALSGGGFRAAAFHLGSLRKLNELGILKDVDVISSVSGGAILAAYYGLNCKDFETFEAKSREILEKGIIGWHLLYDWKLVFFVICLLSTCLVAVYLGWFESCIVLGIWLVLSICFGFKLYPIGRVISDSYDRILFKGLTLSDLPDSPQIAINATNLESGRLMTFSKSKISDSWYEYPPKGGEKVKFRSSIFPIAKAVYASSCVPQFFSPLRIDLHYFESANQYNKVSPTLVDGGIYDNQGISKLIEPKSSYRCDYVIVSDAGNGIVKTKTKWWNNNFWLLIQTVELFFNRIKNMQMQKSIYSEGCQDKRMAFIVLKWKIDDSIYGFVQNIIDEKIDPEVVTMHGITSGEILNNDRDSMVLKVKNSVKYQNLVSTDTSENEYDIVSKTSTNLTPLKENTINALIKRAEVMTELQVKLHCPDLLINKNKNI